MTRLLRVIDTGLQAARWNIAMTAAMAELHCVDQIPDTLRFHRYTRSVLIGRHQFMADAIHIDRCRLAQVEIARRYTGGGAVYMAPGALAWDIVMTRRTLGAQLDRAAGVICEAIAAGLSSLGLCARYRPQNDVEVGGRKICGTSGYFEGETFVQQGTILIDTDLQDMARFLRLPSSLSAHLADRVTTVSEQLGRVPTLGEIQHALTTELSQKLGVEPIRHTPTPQELVLADELHREQYGADAYVEGMDESRPGEALLGHAGSVKAFIHVYPGADRRIDQLWLTGGFDVTPTRAIPDLEAYLRGIPLRDAAEKAIAFLSNSQTEMRGASYFDVAAAIASALRSKPSQHTRPS